MIILGHDYVTVLFAKMLIWAPFSQLTIIYIYIYIHIYIYIERERERERETLCFLFIKHCRNTYTRWSETAFPIVNMIQVINKEAGAT